MLPSEASETSGPLVTQKLADDCAFVEPMIPMPVGLGERAVEVLVDGATDLAWALVRPVLADRETCVDVLAVRVPTLWALVRPVLADRETCVDVLAVGVPTLWAFVRPVLAD
jgi:hypothetical protein